MGAYLETPKTEIETKIVKNELCHAAVASMQGWRFNQEDAYTLESTDSYTFCGIYDGHNGKEVAIFLSRHFYEEMISTAKF